MSEELTQGSGHTEFKDSPVGRIPVGWEVLPINKLGSVITGNTPKTNEKENYGGLIPFISPADMGGTVFIKNTKSKITEKGMSQTRKIPANSVLVVCIGSTIGKVGISYATCASNQQINTIKCKYSDFKFTFYLMTFFAQKIKGLAGTQAVPIINKSEFSSILVQIPPIPEQKKIAKILTSVDEVIETTETQINKLKDLKKGLMNELLTKGIGHTEFKDSPVGRIPVGWEVKKLSAIVKPERAITYGIVQTGEHINNGIPCVRVVDLMKASMPTSEMIKTSLEINSQYKRTILKKGDILFALRGEIGRVRIAGKYLVGANLTRGIALISPSGHCNPFYLLWALRSNNVRKNILDGVNGSALQEIPLGNLRNIVVPIPSLQEQQKIASILTSIDNNIEQKQTKLTQSKNLKKSLMADLLTGRVRVKT